MLTADVKLLKTAALSVIDSLGIKDTGEEPTIGLSADVAPWIDWLANKVKMPAVNFSLKDKSISCPLGARVVKTTAMIKHTVANL